MSKHLDRIGESFAGDVAGHVMLLNHDQGDYKHLCFRSPGGFRHWFDLILWPGNITIDGDWGLWTFKRPRDEQLLLPVDGWPHWLFGEWERQLRSTDPRHSTRELTEESFFEVMLRHMGRHLEDMEDDEAQKWAELAEEWASYGDEDPERAFEEARDYRDEDGRRPFDDFYLGDSACDFTKAFAWSVLAIRWGLAKYNEHKKGA